MLPENNDIAWELDVEDRVLTFAIDHSKCQVIGKIDGLEALTQSIYLRLSIEADQHIIYPYTYGIQTLDLIGKPYYYVVAIIQSRIEEALLSDERITGVTDFEFKVEKNKLHVKFVAHTIYGDTSAETVVNY